jgi:hypothetical protein
MSSGASSLTKRSKTWSTTQSHRAAPLVELVDDDDDGSLRFSAFLQDEPCLWHRPFRGIDEKETPSAHFEDPLHLASEIGMPRGVDDIDEKVLVRKRAVL